MCLLGLGFVLTAVKAQVELPPTEQWRVHASFLNNNDICDAGEKIYVASKTALFTFDKLNRELEVFSRVGHGKTTKQIAGRLDLSPKTIEAHREHIKTKLNLHNAAELSRRAVLWVMGDGQRSC